MDRRRLFYYILLNIFVSAAVTGTILFFYDRSHRINSGPIPVLATLQASTSSALAVSDGIKVNIVSVIGAGTAASEIVVIQNNGVSPLVLTGWLLKDSQGNAYAFPQLSLNPGGTIQVHTASGEDTPVDLYWNRSNPVWASGELATLYDDRGSTRAFYRIP